MSISDFTMETYEKLCHSLIDSSFTFNTVEEAILSPDLKNKIAIMRHDVDSKPLNSLKMAQLESSLGIKSTYYFRFKKGIFVPKIIKQISNLGHEIGYHYEVLYDSRGNIDEAINLFDKQLSEFRKLISVKTISMHGSPMSKWNELEIWGSNNFRDYEIIGEAFTSLDFNKIYYFTDTGRTWNNSKFNIRDRVSSNLSHPKVKSTLDLVNEIKNLNNSLCINTHPQRWTNNQIEWYSEFLKQNVKNFGKRFILPRIR